MIAVGATIGAARNTEPASSPSRLWEPTMPNGSRLHRQRRIGGRLIEIATFAEQFAAFAYLVLLRNRRTPASELRFITWIRLYHTSSR
jgi:hypothetical protein